MRTGAGASVMGVRTFCFGVLWLLQGDMTAKTADCLYAYMFSIVIIDVSDYDVTPLHCIP
jgi:hypothetical protein